MINLNKESLKYSLLILFLIPIFFLLRGFSQRPSVVPPAVVPPKVLPIAPPPIKATPVKAAPIKAAIPPPSVVSDTYSKNPINNTPEHKELEALLVTKGTSICGFINTVASRNKENSKIASAKFSEEIEKQGQLLMELNQATLRELKSKYDIENQDVNRVFRLGAMTCK